MTQNSNTSFLSQKCPTLYHCILLALIGVVLNIWLLAGDGYFSIDELSFAQIAQTHSWAYLSTSVFYPSFFFRPLSSLYTYTAFYFHANAFGVKFLNLLPHIINGLLIYILINNFNQNRTLAFIVSLLFLSSPDAIFSVGWVVCNIDSLWVLFTLCGLLATQRYMRVNSKFAFCCIIACTILALMCKETAVISPGIYFLLACLYGDLRKTETYKVLLAVGLLCIAFFIFRLHVIYYAYHSHSTYSIYNISFGANIWRNIYAYWIFPFYPYRAEIAQITTYHNNYIICAILLHFALIALLAIYTSWRYALGYIALYYCVLLPVITIQDYSTEYLYGTAIVTAVALGILWTKNLFAKLCALLLTLVLLFHSWTVQQGFYFYATCQARILTTLSADLISNPSLTNTKGTIYIYASPTDIRQFPLMRALFNGEIINGQTLNLAATVSNANVPLHLVGDCLVVDTSQYK
jgi:hypothetical protein